MPIKRENISSLVVYTQTMKKMIQKQFPVSFCCGIYNESQILIKKVLYLEKHLSEIFGKGNFEIVIINNGSSDLKESIITTLKTHRVSYYSIPTKGHGKALKRAIEVAKHDHIILSAIDLPFGFTDINQVLPIWNKYDLVFGSKAHARSGISVPLSRKIASVIFRRILQSLFIIPVSDTQGSVFLRKKKIVPLLKFCTAENAFFSAQLAIYGSLGELRITEVPVQMSNKTQRKSKYKIVKDGKEMLITMFREYKKVRMLKENKQPFRLSKV